MPEECALTLDNVRSMRKAYFVERICALAPERMASVCRALAVATACEA
jgi:mRNA-degrading endonuclease toxin of MazEF toxin-antitoxin module